MNLLDRTLFKHVSRSRLKLAAARSMYTALHPVLRDDRRTIERGGIRYSVDISEGLDLSTFLFGSFQKHITDLRYVDLPEHAVILDVGANTGGTALRYAKAVGHGRVYAFEPTDSGFDRLKRNLALNPELARRIVPIQSFVSDVLTQSPDITAYASWDLKVQPTQRRHAIHGGVAATANGVGAITLDSFCEKQRIDHVDLIKIDTDGHEMAVLDGAVGTIDAHRPAVLFEVGLYLLEEHGISFKRFDDFFSARGYTMMNAESGRHVSWDNHRSEIPAKATIDILALPCAVNHHAVTRDDPISVRPAHRPSRVVVIGGGIAGLVASRELARKSDADVVLIERSNTLGGLASSFEIEKDIAVERFYHFICKPDKTYFRLMKELGIYDRLMWQTTEMGLYHDGTLSTFGDPISLARFKPLSWRDKYRFARTSARVKWSRSDGWRKFENEKASEWLIDRYGKRTYEILYEPLMRLKFREFADPISAAWVWARHYRLSKSRTVTQKERIGYLEGGSQLLIDRLEADLRALGVEIRKGTTVDGLNFKNGHCTAVRIGDEIVTCDHLISTMPAPYLIPLVASLGGAYWDNLRSLGNVGVVLILLRLNRKFSKYFWMNISDPRIHLAGIIEFTNLNPCPQLGGDSLVYLPQYVSPEHVLYNTDDEELVAKHVAYLKVINPEFDESWIEAKWVHRERFSQPICRVGFSREIPAMQTPVANMYVTDSHQLHPHDRAVSASIDLGVEVASMLLQDSQARNDHRAHA